MVRGFTICTLGVDNSEVRIDDSERVLHHRATAIDTPRLSDQQIAVGGRQSVAVGLEFQRLTQRQGA